MNFSKFLKLYQKEEVFEFSNQVSEKVEVSVLIQTYNHEHYIAKCLESILAQKTNFAFEIIIGEDFSTDETRRICENYAKNYPQKIKLFLHSKKNKILINGNVSSRFNYMYNLYSAKGEFIALCDGDDYWIDNNKLQKQFDALKSNKQLNLSTHPSIKVLDNTEEEVGIAGNLGEIDKIISAERIVESNAAACPSQAIFFRAKILDDIKEYFVHSPGAHMHIQNMAAIPNGAFYYKEPMAHYRVGSESSVIKNIKNKKSGYFKWLNTSNVVLSKFKKDNPEFKKSFSLAINKNVLAVIKSRQTSFIEKVKILKSGVYPDFFILLLSKLKS